jgi:uncharacterized protein (TIGR02246 family)
MRIVRSLSGVLPVLAMAACTSAPADSTAADTEAINKLRSDYIAAANAEDAAKVAALFTDDGMRMESNMPAIKGRDAIEKGLAQLMEGMDVDISITSEELVIADDWAFDRGQFMTHLMPKDPKQQMVMDQGKYIVILRRGADGSWRIAREIGNSNVPLPPPPSAPAASAAK